MGSSLLQKIHKSYVVILTTSLITPPGNVSEIKIKLASPGFLSRTHKHSCVLVDLKGGTS